MERATQMKENSFYFLISNKDHYKYRIKLEQKNTVKVREKKSIYIEYLIQVKI